MRRTVKSKHDLRCLCYREPLLAVYGLDEKGELYVHMKIWKQKRLFGEIVATGGTVKLKCRECLRWNIIRIMSSGDVEVADTEPPQGIVGV